MNRARVGGAIALLLSASCAPAPAPTHAPPPPAAPAASSAASSAATDFPSEQVLAALHDHWLLRDRVDWPQAERAYRAAIAAATDDAARAKAAVALLASQDDVHSNLQWQGRSFSHYHGFSEEELARLRPLMERDRAQTGRFEGRMLSDGVAYLVVPTVPVAGAEPVAAASRQLQELVARLAREGARSWIVDLRLNGGGNIMPMLAGLRPLLGTGVVATSVDARGARVNAWVLAPDGVRMRDAAGERLLAPLDAAGEPVAAQAPVAVLLGPMTRSSGEGLALAFRGRPRCVLVGEPTARGYCTGLEPVALPGGGTLMLATSFMADRAGHACTDCIAPEIAVAGEANFDDPAADPAVRAAAERIRAPNAAGRPGS
ncbi:MAG: S41 family peptidase [Phycisphaerales bacterium]